LVVDGCHPAAIAEPVVARPLGRLDTMSNRLVGALSRRREQAITLSFAFDAPPGQMPVEQTWLA
jgi:hypothetical protein